MTLVDTDVIIWYMRGSDKAARALAGLGDFAVSAVTYMELVQGMRNRRELGALRRQLRAWACRVVPLDEDISARAIHYVETHFLTHAVRMADALIGATAVAHGVPLLTGNARHYRPIRDLALRQFRP